MQTAQVLITELPGPSWWELLMQWSGLWVSAAAAVGTVAAVWAALSIAKKSDLSQRKAASTRATLAATVVLARLQGVILDASLSAWQIRRLSEQMNRASMDLMIKQFEAIDTGFLTDRDILGLAELPNQSAEKAVAALACLQRVKNDVRHRGILIENWEDSDRKGILFAWSDYMQQSLDLLKEVEIECEPFVAIRIKVPNVKAYRS